ncbi:MAG: SH3 domain-containing protein [Chloroflexia bacterium]|nr:SH3 domain-containing protein [Chloroflexia bacterium]
MRQGTDSRAILAGEARGTITMTGLAARLRKLVLVACAVIAVVVGLCVAPSTAVAGQAGTINTDGVTLMADIDDTTPIATMYAGERVDIFWGPEAGLYEIRYYGTVGWVWADYLVPDGGGGDAVGGGSPAPVTGAGGWAIVDADSLNVRADASTAAAIWDSFDLGTSVQVIGDAVNGFSPISYYGSTAWVASDYLSWNGAVSAPAQPAAVAGERWIDVNRSSGLVTLYEGGSVYASYWGSLGYDQTDGNFNSTASGSYEVFRVYQGLEYTPYANAYITDWVGFDPERSNGFHSWTRDATGNVLPNGAGLTAGCVALEPSQARALSNFAYVGMRVEVHN